MYSNVPSRVQVNGGYNVEFGVHQGSVLSPLLLILVLEALLYEFHIGVPWKLLNADDLVLIADTQEECISKLKVWKAGMESKGLSTWRSSWSLVMTMMASRNLASTPVPKA